MIGIGGYFGRGNFGDDWLLEAVLFDLRTRGETTIDLWPRAWPRFGRLYQEIIFAGGLLQDVTSLRSCLYYTAMAALAAEMAGPAGTLKFCAATLGPLSSRWSRLAIKSLLESKWGRRIIFELRDDASESLLRQLAPHAQYILRPDPTFFVPMPEYLRKGKKKFGVALNGSIHDKGLIDQLAHQIQKVDQEFQLVLFLSHPQRDAFQAKLLLRRLGKPAQVISYEGNTHLFLRRIAGVDSLLSLRLHPAIAALRMGIPVATLKSIAGLTDKIASMRIPSLTEPKLQKSPGNLVPNVLS